MQKVRPYQTYRGLARALDNGGRFFDVLARKGDGKVSRGELAHAAGSRKDATLFLALAAQHLSDEDRERALLLVDRKLADGVREVWRAGVADDLGQVAASYEPGWRVMADGLILPLRDPSLMYVQLAMGQDPERDRRDPKRLDDLYDLWELRARDSRTAPWVHVFFRRPRKTPLPEGAIRLAGVVQQTARLMSGARMRFVAPMFYVPLDGAEPQDADEDDDTIRAALRHRVT